MNRKEDSRIYDFIWWSCARFSRDSLNPTRKIQEKVTAVCKLLIQEYGHVIVERALDPIGELVFTILSQNTADVNTKRAFGALRSRYATWDDVLVAADDELAGVIRSSGPFRVKAKRIKAALSEIKRRTGRLDLSLLAEMETQDAMNWLTTLYGVGPKTAAIVLLFCFEKPVLPVDTHVWRVSKRLGLVPSNASRESTQNLLEDNVPEYCVYSMNHNLIRHGRTLCRAQKPHCRECFLAGHCDYYSNLQDR
ncbi:MAG: endonuclease III domain-containing protein [Candidatus Thorarchaeota archaeon SMTZ1-83]